MAFCSECQYQPLINGIFGLEVGCKIVDLLAGFGDGNIPDHFHAIFQIVQIGHT